MEVFRSLSAKNSLEVAGRFFKESSKLMFFRAGVASAGYMTFINAAATQYQVPVGKKLVIKAAIVRAAANALMVLGYGDTATSGAAPTNNTNFTIGTLDYTAAFAGTATGQEERLIPNFEVPAGKYPYLEALTADIYSAFFICELQDA